MRDEGHYCEEKIREGEEYDDCESEIGDSLISKEGENDEPGEEQEDTDGKEGRQQIDDPDNDELAHASGKVFSGMGTKMRWPKSFNYLEVSASPLLQKRGQKGTDETEHKVEEPCSVDKYNRSGGGEGELDRRTWGVTGIVSIGVGKLLGYLCEEEVGGDVGILLQGRVADGDKGSHRGRKKANLRPCKYTTVVTDWTAKNRTKTRAFSALPFQFSTFSRSNFSARLMYIEKMTSEVSRLVVWVGVVPVASSPAFSEGACSEEDMMAMSESGIRHFSFPVNRLSRSCPETDAAARARYLLSSCRHPSLLFFRF